MTQYKKDREIRILQNSLVELEQEIEFQKQSREEVRQKGDMKAFVIHTYTISILQSVKAKIELSLQAA